MSVLSAIAAIAECAPYAFNAEGAGGKAGWGRRALDFCLDTALLGRNGRLNGTMEESSDGEDEESSASRKSGGKGAKRSRSRSKKADNEVSVRCRMLCGAIEVLVSHIRSTIINGKLASESGSSDERDDELEPPSSKHISRVFDALTTIIEDGGAPPSDDQNCTSPSDEAELRRAAAVGLLRLCDPNLRLEASHLSPRAWHVLGSALLDTDKSARAAVLSELSRPCTPARRGSAPAAPRPSRRACAWWPLRRCAQTGTSGGATARRTRALRTWAPARPTRSGPRRRI